jgi:hypothetical protein
MRHTAGAYKAPGYSSSSKALPRKKTKPGNGRYLVCTP